jgi:hypothetical protein
MAREVNEPLSTAAPEWHPPVEAPVAKFYDESFSDLDRKAAEVCLKAHLCARWLPIFRHPQIFCGP